jgi:hypothetical protein
MNAWSFVLSIVAILISATALGWQIRRWRWEQRHHVKVEGRSETFVTKDGEQIPIVGVRVTNNNPKYPIRVKAVAFTPADQEVVELWFDAAYDQLPAVIEPHDADTIDIPIERISEVGDPLGSAFIGWIELKTGDIFRSEPHTR